MVSRNSSLGHGFETLISGCSFETAATYGPLGQRVRREQCTENGRFRDRHAAAASFGATTSSAVADRHPKYERKRWQGSKSNLVRPIGFGPVEPFPAFSGTAMTK
jgi:hypothetical protein